MRFSASGKARPNEHYQLIHPNIDRCGAHLFMLLLRRIVSADFVNEFIMLTIRKLLCVAFFIWTNLLSAQSPNEQKLLHVRFPIDGDTVTYTKIRIAGSTLPAARVTINGQATRVYPSGAFVGRVDLKPLDNEITIIASDSSNEERAVLHIYRTPPLPVSPERPTQLDPRVAWPEEDIVLVSGDLLEVRIKGSPGGKAWFSIPGLCKNIAMTELPPDDAQGMRGIYAGAIRLHTKKSFSPRPVKFELRGIDGKKAQALSKGLVSVVSDAIPIVGETKNTTHLKTAPSGWGVMSILPPGVRLHLIGQRGTHFKVHLTESDYAYVASSDVTLLPQGTPVPKTTISLPSIGFDGDWIQLSMNVQTNCPYQIQQSIDPPLLELIVYGAHLTSQWITYPSRDTTIKLIRWQQPSADVFKLIVELNQPQQWGHRVRFGDGKMILEIRRTPKIAAPPKSPVAGLIFTLDAGHGGKEFGAVGATGLMEKDVNLAYTKKLAALLDSAGAKVVLTRQTDTTLSLAERINIARRANTHIFCWLHNNSIGASSDPLAVRGTSTYFTIPQNCELARAIYPYLLELGLTPFGFIQSDYYVTRQTDMLIVLVEGAFMSHPEDEMLLMDDRFLDRLARAVFRGLEEFCRKQNPIYQ
ncbi:MAG: N-acetylmuramoyl-L-alanine amidase [candidate division KSB1 bacterium]|nr:N-acetylmuramoyl-L-alanine amidase [candidate division KSB1 bacterium]